MILLQPQLLCKGWGGHSLCLSGDSPVLMDLHWPCDCTAQYSNLSIGSVFLVVQGDWNAKVDKDACGNWQGMCGSFCDNDTNERGPRLQEYATFNDLVLANIFGHYEASRRWT